MLAGKRAVRVGDQILREIADLLSRKVRDPRVRKTTVTAVHLSNDLKCARVYFSVYGDDKDVREAEAGLNSAKGFIKREIGRRLELKYMPDLIFRHDPSLEMGEHLKRLFEKLNREGEDK
ncbi:MAG: 30S ribosome-binding factor RbfA [Deltaproteobacteria bacterium]|nr:30S ribosome-binding factor RbfA [Deltaproteobacteria bacterium]